MARRNIIAALVLIAVGAWYAFLTAGLPERTLPNTPGPSFFPGLIAGALLVLSACLLGQGMVMRRAGAAGRAGDRRPSVYRAGALVWFAAYLAALPHLGFVVASVPFFAGLMLLYGGRGLAWLAGGSIGVPVVLFYLFREAFQILLPQGALAMIGG